MRHFLKLTDYTVNDFQKIFKIADYLAKAEPTSAFKGKTVILFFPESGIRTRAAFEKGIALLGGQSVLFSSGSLDKNEELKDMAGYLNQWADTIVVRHGDYNKLEEFVKYAEVPVINAMTSVNHPCEIITDLYSLSKLRPNYKELSYLYVGADSNIGRAWQEAVKVFGLDFRQCCPEGYELNDAEVEYDLSRAIEGSDIILTDSIPEDAVEEFKDYIITKDLMDRANKGALLNPCPPFIRGREVSDDVMDSEYFVGYSFKQPLLLINQALLLYCMD